MTPPERTDTKQEAARPPREVVKGYLEAGFRIVTWPAVGDIKGPTERGWPERAARGGYTLADYHEGDRVGLLTGVEVSPGRFLHDVDLDWAEGAQIALALLPSTAFVYGRKGKRISHCFYTLPEALPSIRYEDVDKGCLLEFRGTKVDGTLGLQSMSPPSEWSKGELRELLQFLRHGAPSFVEDPKTLLRALLLSAIALILAKHLGHNGFGHDARLAWAGFLLRAGFEVDELIKMGEAISPYCNNTEVMDVRRVVESTAANLARDAKKVKGGPSLAAAIGEKGKAVIARINEWLGREDDFVRNTRGAIIPGHYGNIKRAIAQLGHELQYDEFAEQSMIDGVPLEDPQLVALRFEIEEEYHVKHPADYFKDAVNNIAHRNKFHPVRQYLDTLSWDGLPRVDAWLIGCAGAVDNAYVRAVSAIMLIAAVRRIRQPGCKYDEMVVWESQQGTNKSSAAQALCPNPGWFSDDLRLNLYAKEMIEATLGKWIIEASDLAGKRKAEIEQLKAMLSRQRDGPARMAYARLPVHRPRHFIIVGTTNSSVYLTDPTGGRRFWPITVSRFDLGWIHAHRDQLWAEASVREAAGESIRLKEELWPEASKEQERRQEIDPWEPILRMFLQKVEVSGDGKRRISTEELWNELNFTKERRDRSASLRIGDVMARLGFRRTRVRSGGEVQVGFVQETAGGLILEAEDGEEEIIKSAEDDDIPF